MEPVQRVRDVIDGCGFVTVHDLNDYALRKVAGYLNERKDKDRTDGGFSHQTAHFYLAAARRFIWWLNTKQKAPVRIDLFDDVPGFEPDNHRVHARRAVTIEELGVILEATRSGIDSEGLTGEARYFLYLTAFATGFRASSSPASSRPTSLSMPTYQR